MTGATPDVALSAHGLGKRFGSTWALSSVDLDVPIGSVTALVGPNGAGKSTLIRAWMAFERPTTGSVAVLGMDPWADRRRAVGSIGYVAQAPALYRDLSVERHLVFARTMRPAFDTSLARDRLRRLGIRLDARPTQLSGGEIAQVGLAIALGTRAPILLLDEPLANLDPLARRDFLSTMLETVRSEGTTVVLSSHIITDVEAACDRIVVLGRGTKLLDAAVHDLLSGYLVVPAAEASGHPDLVASFDRAGGEAVSLVRAGSGHDGGPGRSATLEDVVIGFLASGRAPRS